MKHNFFRLNSPRPTFPGDMTPEEAVLMGQHSEYWRGLMAQGKVVALGPVADPTGFFGIGVLALEDSDYAQTLVENDPVAKAGGGFILEVYLMPRIMRP